MSRRPLVLAAPLAALAISACLPTSGQWRPRNDWIPPPRTQAYSEPGWCQGGSQLAAEETPLPDYPPLAFRNGTQGWAILLLDVGPSGAAQNVRVVLDAPPDVFEGAARNAVEDWRFVPPETPLTDCLVRIDFRAGRVAIGG